MSGWLTGKRTRLIGAGEALQHAIVAAGGTITDGDDADLLIHAAAPAPQAPAQRMDHATWRDAIDTGLDQLFHAARGAQDPLDLAAGAFGHRLAVERELGRAGDHRHRRA